MEQTQEQGRLTGAVADGNGAHRASTAGGERECKTPTMILRRAVPARPVASSYQCTSPAPRHCRRFQPPRQATYLRRRLRRPCRHCPRRRHRCPPLQLLPRLSLPLQSQLRRRRLRRPSWPHHRHRWHPPLSPHRAILCHLAATASHGRGPALAPPAPVLDPTWGLRRCGSAGCTRTLI